MLDSDNNTDRVSSFIKGKNIFAKDPYLVLRGPSYSPKEKMASFVNTIRRESEWAALGFNTKSDKHGNYHMFKKDGLFYRLRRCSNEMLTVEQLAALTEFSV